MPSRQVFVLASGSGVRWGEGQPKFKQLLECPIEKRPIICRTVERLAKSFPVAVVTPHAEIVEALIRLPKWVKEEKLTVMDVGSPALMTDTLLLTVKDWKDRNLVVLGDVWFSERAFRAMETAMEADRLVFWGRRERSFLTNNTGETFSFQWCAEHKERMVEAIGVARKQWEDAGFGGYDEIGTPFGATWQLYRHLHGIPLTTHSTEAGGWEDINDFTDDFDRPNQYEFWLGRFNRRLVHEPVMKSIGDFDDWRPSSQLKPLQVIILSTGHSGTGYAAKLLTSAGIRCGHEGVFRDKVLSEPRYQADSSFFAVAHLDHPRAQGAKLVHLTRHPLQVIRSWRYGGTSPNNDRWCEHVLRSEGLLDFEMKSDDLESLAWRWVRWTDLIEKKAPKAIQVCAEDRRQILSDIGLREKMADDLDDNPTYNAKKGAKGAPEVQWSDLGRAEIAVREKAARYGYA